MCIGLTVTKDPPSRVKPCGDPLPGRLCFYLPAGWHKSDCSPLNESTAEVTREASLPEGAAEGEGASVENNVAADSYVPMAASPMGRIALVYQASHNFLETRFKTQQLWGPEPYMAFLLEERV